MRPLILRRVVAVFVGMLGVSIAILIGYTAASLLTKSSGVVTSTEVALARAEPTALPKTTWQRSPLSTSTSVPAATTHATSQTEATPSADIASQLKEFTNPGQPGGGVDGGPPQASAIAASTATPSVQATLAVPPRDDLQPTSVSSTRAPAPVELGTATERFAEDTFDSSQSGWLERDTPTWNAAYVDGRYRITVENQQSLNFASPLTPGNYEFSVDLAVKQGRAGVVFLAAKPATFYRFMISAGGVYALQVQEGARTHNLIDWTYSNHLQRPIGEANRLRVERENQTVRFFVNEQLLTTWTVPDADVVNQYGFAIESSESRAEATFDNLVGDRALTAGE